MGSAWSSYDSYRATMIQRIVDVAGIEDDDDAAAGTPIQNGLLLEF